MKADVTARCVQVPLVAESAPAEVSLPEWIAPLLLAGLVAVSGLIVLVGWLVTLPPSRAVLVPKPYTQVQQPSLAVRPSIVSENTPEVEPLPPDDEGRHLQGGDAHPRAAGPR